MRYSADHKSKTRAQILEAAMALLVSEGPAAVTIHGVMRAAGLSHGGFYAHFDSRDALLEAAISAAAARTLGGLFAGADPTNDADPRDVIGRYLGRAHLETKIGCPLPAMCGGDLHEGAEAVRREVVARYTQALTAIAPDEKTADALLALMVGGLAVARAQGGEDGEATLRACRRAARAIIDA
jgi:TetR/AcrR family transcriptional regulator, transcriptional repressor for nem operon